MLMMLILFDADYGLAPSRNNPRPKEIQADIADKRPETIENVKLGYIEWGGLGVI